jgi:SAM-dependent methyltransferase
MVKIDQSPNYKDVSSIYNHIMRKVRYDHWADYIYAISNNYLKNNPRVLELASGQGQLAHFLSAYYPKIIASDQSNAMLTNLNKYEFKKVCCDMRLLPFKSKFDLIFSAFDSINYLITRNDLNACFSEVKKILHDKGLFTFDVSLEKNSYKHIKDPIREGSYKGIRYKQETDFDSKKRIHRNIFHIAYPNGQTHREVHLQKIYEFETYFDVLESVGFVVKECFETFTFNDGNAKSSRIQFIAIKK